MDSWPTDNKLERTTVTLNAKGKPKKRDKRKLSTLETFPHLQVGSIGALTLIEKDGRLEWSSLVNADPKGQTKLISTNALTLFPITRPLPTQIPKTTILHRAEQGANFLRTYLPDIDIPSHIIREELTEDYQVARQLNAFDSQAGNRLAHVFVHDPVKDRTRTYLVFPMGELGCDLNISPFSYSVMGEPVFSPFASPARTFDTPIRQIVSIKFLGDERPYRPILAIRTYSNTYVVEVKSTSGRPGFELVELVVLNPSDVGSRAIVDVQMDIRLVSLPATAALVEAVVIVVVNDLGAVYQVVLGKNIETINLVHQKQEAAVPGFWRVAIGEGDTICYLVSSHEVSCVDIHGVSSVIFHLSDPRDAIASVENVHTDAMLRICTLSDILWISTQDLQPQLAIKHDREPSQYLRTDTIYGDHPLTCLTSQKNGLVTTYNVSISPTSGLIHLNQSPYRVTDERSSHIPFVGQTFVHHPFPTSSLSLCRLDERGRLTSVDLKTSPMEGMQSRRVWSNEVKALDEHASQLRETLSILGDEQDGMKMDPVSKYRRILEHETGKPEETEAERKKWEETNSKAALEVLDQLPSFWQRTEVSIDDILTSFDLVLRTGEDMTRSTLTNPFARTALHSEVGHRALLEGQLSARALDKGASWHHNITPTLLKLGMEVDADPTKLDELLRHFDTQDLETEDPEVSVKTIRKRALARQELVMDLALSSDIYSSNPFSMKPPFKAQQDLETMAGALTLNAEPPHVEFGFIRPHIKKNKNRSRAGPSDEEGAVVRSLGTRLLLQEWETGTDPDKFEYRDPYGEDESRPSGRAVPRLSSLVEVDVAANPGIKPQRPPMVLAASAIAPVPPPLPPNRVQGQSQANLVFASQGMWGSLAGSSQEPTMNTQIVSGPYGARPSATGQKRPQKKRLGGF